MCSIGGIIKTDKRTVFDEELQLDTIALLKEMQDRGDHAWGVYIEKTGNNNYHLSCGVEDETLNGEIFKMPGKFTDFLDEHNGVIYLDNTHTVLLHTRQATQGSSDDNINNHPFSTKDFILAHNGIVTNDSQLKDKYKIKTKIECDSYIIVHLIQHFCDKGNSVSKSIKLTLNEIEGGFACWLYHKPSKSLYVFRNSRNPLEYYIDDKNKVFIFASEDKYILNVYNSDRTLAYRDIDTLDPMKIFKLVSGELVEVEEFGTPPEKDDDTSKFCNSADLSKIDSFDLLMGRFYGFLHTFDANNDFSSILTRVGAVTYILVDNDCKILEESLDQFGFQGFKKPDTQKNKWIRYTIPVCNMEALIEHTLSLVNPDYKPISPAPLLTDDNLFYRRLSDFCSSNNITLCNVEDVLSLTISDRTPIRIKEKFSEKGIGFKFSDTDGELKLRKCDHNITRLNRILDWYFVEED